MIGPSRPLLLAGCGKMGEALLGGWLESGFSADCFIISDPSVQHLKGKPETQGTGLYTPESLPTLEPSIIFVAVKPQQFDGVVAALKPQLKPDTLVISIAAGKGLETMEALLGPDVAAIRAMPNTPALIRKGVTVACANRHVSREQKQTAEALLGAVGAIFWVEDEALLDPVTALSGSGPAYVFLFLEWLVQAGVATGLPETLAQELAILTVSGSSELAYHSIEALSQLRKNVTSPGGTTEAALAVLLQDNMLETRFKAALFAATERAAALRKI